MERVLASTAADVKRKVNQLMFVLFGVPENNIIMNFRHVIVINIIMRYRKMKPRH